MAHEISDRICQIGQRRKVICFFFFEFHSNVIGAEAHDYIARRDNFSRNQTVIFSSSVRGIDRMVPFVWANAAREIFLWLNVSVCSHWKVKARS